MGISVITYFFLGCVFLARNKNQSVLNGALILAVSTVVVKLIGALYKIPLTGLIGAVGRGYFNSAYEIYTPLYAISMAGLPVAVSRLVAENVALHRYREARMIFRVAKRIFLITGISGTLIMLAIAYPYTHYVADYRNLPAVLAIAPSIFFCCAMSSYRGYYEGLRNMTPTAVSQVIEAVGKLVIGLGLSYAVMKIGLTQFQSTGVVFGREVADEAAAFSTIYPIAAAGAVLGVTFGTVFGLIYMYISHKIKGDGFTRVELVNSPKPVQSTTLAKRIVMVAIPMVASALILNLTNLIDTVTIQNRLAYAISQRPDIIKDMFGASFKAANILDKDIVKYLYGTYGSVLDFRNLIPTITMSLGVSALPAISAAWAIKDNKSIKTTIESVLRVTMLIALPAGIGMAVLSKQILTIVYGGSNADIIPIAAPIMATYGYATALMALSTPITNLLQGIGRTDIPVKSLLVGSLIKISCNYFIVGNPNYNINGAPYGSILCYIAIVCINLFSLLKISRVKINIVSIFIKPMFCSALCGATAWAMYGLSYSLFEKLNFSSHLVLLSTVISILFAVIVYFISLLLIKGISKDDITMLPKGEKIAKVLAKYGLLG